MIKQIARLSSLLFLLPLSSFSQTIFTPTDDGYVNYYGPIDFNYVSVGGPDQGDLHFAPFNASSYPTISLELNAYAWPLLSDQISVYGFTTTSPTLTSSDYNDGTFLGTWNFSANPYFSGDIYFDVTSFVQSVEPGDYIGFNLQASDDDTFSSTTRNYGTPPELIATPEPSSLALAALGFFCVLPLLRKHRRKLI